MKVICDLEANGLEPTAIHVIVCKQIETGETNVFRADTLSTFKEFASKVHTWVGHNFLGYDIHAIRSVLGISIDPDTVVDTLVCSRLFDTLRERHSLEEWGVEFGTPKVGAGIADWSVYTVEMEHRCISDVEINYKLYQKFSQYLSSERWKDAIRTEHFIHFLCSQLHRNGFAFSLEESKLLKETIDNEIKEIDKELLKFFLPKITLVREVTPRVTKHGTIARNSIPKVLGNDYSPFHPDSPFSLIEFIPFNPGSPKQIVERMNEAGWQPYEKTKGHKDTEKALYALKRKKPTRDTLAEIASLEARLGDYRVYGWTVSEENLDTLPSDAPAACDKLARRLKLANRSSTLQTWMDAYDERTGRIHGNFNHIGAWTQRMSHDRPNMGNVPKFDSKQPEKTPYSDKMRSLWCAAPQRLLVGVDAESIQLRIFAHYIKDDKFTNSLISGRKEDGSDPHSLNQAALGYVCKSRDDAKTFIYAWLLGAGTGKIAAILGCSMEEARRANDNFLEYYPGLKHVKEKIIPYDAARGYFEGLDGRYVRIWGDDTDARRHFALAGYLQNGEVIIMKRAVQIWYPKLKKERVPFWWVNFVHDEWQTETIDDMDVARYVADTQAEAIKQVGIDLGLDCPFAGSVLNSHGKLAIGLNWMETH